MIPSKKELQKILTPQEIKEFSDIRRFESGATRSSSDGKIEQYGFRHPLVEHSFGKYMKVHQVQENGERRTSNNWWCGWSEDISIQSLVRHVEDLQAIQAGLYVYKVKGFDGENTVVSIHPIEELEETGARVSKDDCYNAARFNCTAGLLEHLKKESNDRQEKKYNKKK